ncbi:MAG: hypothetical protein ACUVS1_08610 [Actinomycetota bacterium]
MRTLLDILRLLFFPGLASMLLFGSGLLFLNRKAAEALLGLSPGGEWSMRGGRDGGEAWGPRESAALSTALVALGLGAVLLVEVRGDLLALSLLFASSEALPLVMLRQGRDDRGAAFLPLAFRAALSRSATFFFIAAALSLRFPGTPDPSLGSFRGDYVFAALNLWGGPRRAAVAAALALAGLSLIFLVLGDPAWETGVPLPGRVTEGWAASFLRAGERAFLSGALLVLFLGYPGEGNGGYVAWMPAALGVILMCALLRAASLRHGRVGKRKTQAWAMALALLSLGVMVGSRMPG